MGLELPLHIHSASALRLGRSETARLTEEDPGVTRVRDWHFWVATISAIAINYSK
jgi:hypothetical protein